MTRQAIVAAASKIKTTKGLLALLNQIKKDELGDKAHAFTLKQLNYFINPKRNRDCYKTFTIPKKSGGVRTISAPVKMLKSFLQYTNILLQAFYDAPDCVTGFVPAKSVVDNAERHTGMNYVFNTDLKDFFPSISKSRVWATLKSKPFEFNDTIADAIAGLCCTYVNKEGEPDNIALPQGSPCSPILTNIVCHNLDRKLAGVAKRFGLVYSRYADDITFSSMHNVFQEDGEFIKELRSIVEGQNLTINEKKTRLQKKGERMEVTGLVVSDRVNVPREYVRDLDNLLYIWKKHGRASAFAKFAGRYVQKQNLGQPSFDMERVVAGRLAYLRMVKGEESLVWRRLQKRYNLLVGRTEKSTGTDIQYLNYYTIDNFIAATGLQLHFRLEDKGFPCEEPEDKQTEMVPVVFFMSGEQKVYVRLSRYMSTRLGNILEAEDKTALAQFTHKHIIAYCHGYFGYFWMIIRNIPKKEKIVSRMQHRVDLLGLGDELSPFDIFGYGIDDTALTEEEEALMNNPQVSGLVADLSLTTPDHEDATNKALKKLVDSNFDLKTLDEWDKIRNN